MEKSAAEEKVEKLIREGVDRRIDDVYDMLFKNRTNAQLEESIFVQRFLPFFSGLIKDDENLSLTTYWISIAGTPMASVDIVDLSGNLLYTVPPLWNSNFIHTKPDITTKPFHQIFKEASTQSTRIPTLGSRIIATEGVSKVLSMPDSRKENEVSDWDKIFKRYNIETPGKKKAEVEKKKPNSPDMDFNFD